MCEPTTIAAISLAATAASGYMQMQGQIQQGKAAQAQANYQAAVARNNQIIAERQAEDARARGDVEASRQASRTRQLIGRQRAVLAGNNVVVDQDSALDITTDTAGIGKLDELTIRSNAEREALGFETQGMNFGADAALAQARGRSARSASRSAAFSTLLSTTGSVANKWYGYKKAGVAGF